MKKDAVKLAVIGGTKQGKTRLLQELTGLKYGLAAEWPHLGMDPSVYTVCHVPEMEEGSVRAVIRFRKREKLLENIRKCLTSLDSHWEQDHDLSFDTLDSKRFRLMVDILSADTQMIMEGSAGKKMALRNLQYIVSHFQEIKDFYGREDLILADADRLKEYLATEQMMEPGDQPSWKWMAVERADMFCNFGSDIPPMILMDPGTILQDVVWNRKIITAALRECDAAVIVTAPVGGIQKRDKELYKILKEYSRWEKDRTLFYLVNRITGYNDPAADHFAREVKEHFTDIRYCTAVDLSDGDQVRNYFLRLILQLF